jgi:AcrR family transcriptional regulator
MVHNDSKRTRGRPKAYDPEQALSNATNAFWEHGFSGTSVDVLSDVTDMNRPSMYAAFGDKRALYLRTLERYTENAKVAMQEALDPKRPLQEGLRAMFDQALKLYVSNSKGARGCYLIGTAATEAASDDDIRKVLHESLRSFETLLVARFEEAIKSGELPDSADADGLAITASAFLHSLAVRARAGDSRAKLKSLIDIAIESTSSSQTR